MTDREALDIYKNSHKHNCLELMEADEVAYNALQERIDRENKMQKPMTNADRIRAMSDEELAEDRVSEYEEYPGVWWAFDGNRTFGSQEEAVAFELEYLRQPAKED